MGGFFQYVGQYAGLASKTYSDYLNAQTEQDRIEAERDVGIANAAAGADGSAANRRILENVLLGAGVLLAFMVAKKALA